MIKHLVGRFFTQLTVLVFFALGVLRTVLDIVGYTTVPSDAADVPLFVQQAVQALLSVPLWVIWPTFVFCFAWVAWVSWSPQPRTTALAKTATVVKGETMASIGAGMRYAQGCFRRAKKGMDLPSPKVDLEELEAANNRFRAIEISLKKKGFVTPWLDYSIDPVGYLIRNLDYIDKVEPLIARRHIKEAKRQARLIVARLHPDFIDPNRL